MPLSRQTQHCALIDLIGDYDTFLLDAYGVFWASTEIGLLPGAREAMEHLVSHGKKVGILSNTTQLAQKEQHKLAQRGVLLDTHYHFIITSGEATLKGLLQNSLPFPTPRKTYCLLGSDHPRFSSHTALFNNTQYQQVAEPADADFLYIAIPHIDGCDQEDPQAFHRLTQEAARFHLPVLCANPDRFAHEGNPPRPVVRQGTIGQMLQELGAAVHFVGKPYPAIYREALTQCGTTPDRILMIGDTPETDIRGARALGIASALVMQTGIASERAQHIGATAFLSRLPPSDQPDFAIPRLCI